MTLQNEKRFDAKANGGIESAIIKESRLIWNPISIESRQIKPFLIQTSELELEQGLFFQLGDFTEEEGELYSLKSIPARAYIEDDSVHFQIAYERDLKKYSMEVSVYGLLEMLGDIGGLSEVLWMVGALIISFFQF